MYKLDMSVYWDLVMLSCIKEPMFNIDAHEGNAKTLDAAEKC